LFHPDIVFKNSEIKTTILRFVLDPTNYRKLYVKKLAFSFRGTSIRILILGFQYAALLSPVKIV